MSLAEEGGRARITGGDSLVSEGQENSNVEVSAVVDWGGIGGTLADQTDLANELNAKFDKAGGRVGGINFGAVPALSPQALGNHISLYEPNYGLNVTSYQMNLVAGTEDHPNKFAFWKGTDLMALIQDPITDPHALTTKEYVDNAVTASTQVTWGSITGNLASQADLKNALDSKLGRSGAILAGPLNAGGNHLQNVATPTDDADAATKAYVDSGDSGVRAYVDQQIAGISGLKWGGIAGTLGDQADLSAALASKIPVADIGVANGVATLDGNGKVPPSQLSISGGLNYRGSWDASTNTPSLVNGSGTNGDLYKVAVAGVQDLGAGATAYAVGDLVVYASGASAWERFVGADAVTSVNGKSGDVHLSASDVNADTAGAAQAVHGELTSHEGEVGAGAHVPTGGTLNQVLTRGSGSSVAWADVQPAIWGTVEGTLSAQTDLGEALGSKADQSALTAHVSDTGNPHSVTKAQVGLGNVDNTADADKPVSTAMQAALDTKITTPTLTSKVVLGTTLETSTLGLVGYSQDATGDTLAMRQFGGQVSTAEPVAGTDAATKNYVDTALGAAVGSGGWSYYYVPSNWTSFNNDVISYNNRLSGFSSFKPGGNVAQTWILEFDLYVSAGPDVGLKMGFGQDAIVAGGVWGSPLGGQNTWSYTPFVDDQWFVASVATDTTVRKYTGVVTYQVTAQLSNYDLVFTTCQNTAGSTQVTVYAGSVLRARRIA